MPKVNYATDYCTAEIMAAVMSKKLKGVRRASIGAFSQIPWSAIRLAQSTHSPDIWFTCGPSGVVNSKFHKLAWYVGDYRMHVGAESRFNMDSVLDSFGNPRCWSEHVLFFGGIQIDKYGNVNMAFIGEHTHPKFRGPGTIGLMSMALGPSVILFTHTHSPRTFVEKVDFISGPGFLDGPGAREKAGCPPNSGPRYLITPIAVFDFDEETKILRLKSVHPGHTVEEVKSRTGFSPIIPAHVPETEPPTVEEVAFMRAFDPDGILPQLTG